MTDMQAELASKVTYASAKEAICQAFRRPECVRRAGLHIELHIGRKQAVELYGDTGGKWPRTLLSQMVYLVGEDDHFEVLPRGMFKKLDNL